MDITKMKIIKQILCLLLGHDWAGYDAHSVYTSYRLICNRCKRVIKNK